MCSSAVKMSRVRDVENESVLERRKRRKSDWRMVFASVRRRGRIEVVPLRRSCGVVEVWRDVMLVVMLDEVEGGSL